MVVIRRISIVIVVMLVIVLIMMIPIAFAFSLSLANAAVHNSTTWPPPTPIEIHPLRISHSHFRWILLIFTNCVQSKCEPVVNQMNNTLGDNFVSLLISFFSRNSSNWGTKLADVCQHSKFITNVKNNSLYMYFRVILSIALVHLQYHKSDWTTLYN